jgi:hypothetical protein
MTSFHSSLWLNNTSLFIYIIFLSVDRYMLADSMTWLQWTVP